MFHSKRVKVEIIDIISNIQRAEIGRDLVGEHNAQHNSRYRKIDGVWDTFNSYSTSYQCEDDLYEYTRDRSGYYIKKDEWSGEFRLLREYMWYEIKVKIKYCISKVVYEKEIEIESKTRNIKSIVVYCDRKNPDRILKYIVK